MNSFIKNIEFLIHPDLAKRIEKDKSVRQAVASLYKKIRKNTPGLVPKKLKGYENMYEIRCSIKLRVVYSRYMLQGEGKYVFWDLTNHDSIDNRTIFAPVTVEGAAIDYSDGEDFEPVIIKDGRIADYYKALYSENISEQIIHACDSDVLERMTSEEILKFPWYIHTDQIDVLNRPLPMCVNGPPGTGKTTLGVYKLVNQARNHPGNRVLYVTYTGGLVEFAKMITRSMASEDIFDRITFTTFHELVKDITGNKKDILSKELFLSAFPPFYRRNRSGKGLDYDMDELWIIIRSIIKGKVKDTERVGQLKNGLTINPVLSVADIELINLDKKNIKISAADLAVISLLYEKFLSERNLLDEIDLARMAVEKLPSPLYRFDMLFCDEIQDFTDLQQTVLHRLMKHKTDNHEYPFFLCGDEGQMIHPSGFSWDHFKDFMREFMGMKKIEIVSLGKNYRSPDTVVNLSNALMQERKKKCGAKSTDKQLEYIRKGEGPYFIDNSEFNDGDFKGMIGPGTMIITRDEQEKRRLKALGVEDLHLFTVHESKGLEYEHVVLWNFLDILKEYGGCNNFELKGDYRATIDYNSFYVGITRALDTVFIADDYGNREYLDAIEGVPEIDSRTFEEFLEIQSSVDDDWEKRANKLLHNGNFWKAADAFKKCNKHVMSEYCQGLAHKKEGDYRRAFECFIKTERWDEAGEVAKSDEGMFKILMQSIMEKEDIALVRKAVADYISNGNNDDLLKWIRSNLDVRYLYIYMRMVYRSESGVMHGSLVEIQNALNDMILENMQ